MRERQANSYRKRGHRIFWKEMRTIDQKARLVTSSWQGFKVVGT